MTDPDPKLSEEECRQITLEHKYPNGFQCEGCGHTSSYAVTRRPIVKCGECGHGGSQDATVPFKCVRCEHEVAVEVSKPPLIECAGCKKQTSITAGTFFHGFKIELWKVFYMIKAIENGICESANAWAKILDIAPRTAWRWLQKISRVIAESFAGNDGEEVHYSLLRRILFRPSLESPSGGSGESLQDEADERLKETAASKTALDAADEFIESVSTVHQAISRKYSEPYANLYNFVTEHSGRPGLLLSACVSSRRITDDEIVSHSSPEDITLLPPLQSCTAGFSCNLREC